MEYANGCMLLCPRELLPGVGDYYVFLEQPGNGSVWLRLRPKNPNSDEAKVFRDKINYNGLILGTLTRNQDGSGYQFWIKSTATNNNAGRSLPDSPQGIEVLPAPQKITIPTRSPQISGPDL